MSPIPTSAGRLLGVVALAATAACSASGGGAAPGQALASTSPPTSAATEPTPTPSAGRRGVVCKPVDDAVARKILGRARGAITAEPGRAVAYQPPDLGGTYLVVVVFDEAGRDDFGVWAVRRSIGAHHVGAITAVDRVARAVTSWPRSDQVGATDVRVSEARACTLV